MQETGARPADTPDPGGVGELPTALGELGLALVDAAPDAMVVVDDRGRVRLANRQVEVLFGYARAELIDAPVELLLPERHRGGHTRLREAYAAAPAVRPMGRGQVLHARRKDGTEFPAEISLSPVQVRGQRLVMAAIRDSTEREALLRQAEAAEARFRGLLEGAPDAMVIAGADGRIMLVNRQAEALLGYGRDELIGQPVERLMPAGLRPGHAGHRAAYTAGPRPRPMGAGLDLVALRKDGTEVAVEISLSPVHSADGPLVSAAIRDVSERRAAEAVTRRHAALLDLVPAAVLVRDWDGTVTYWNRAAERMYGWTAAEALGRVVHELLGTRFPESREARDAALAAEGTWEGEVAQTRKDGSTLFTWTHQAVQRGPDGAPRAVLQVHTDLSALKEAEAALQRSAEELARSNAELEQFAYVASHDLQEPLRIVASYTQLLARRYRGQLDEDADEFIGFAVDGAQRMQRLINDLLAYARVGTQDRPLAPTDSGAVLREVLVDLGVAIAEHEARVAHDALPTVLADPQQLHSLLLNLVGNALKYRSDDPPRVHVGAEQRGDWWELAVADNGIGLDPGDADRIFRPFQRLHTQAEYPGTGIGLAICKKIVERHGGRLWVDSAPGQGSTFRFTLRSAGGG